MAAHTHLLHSGHAGAAWKLWLAAIGVVILATLGLYYGILDWRRGAIDQGLMAFGPFVAAAIVYAFGYLWCLADVLGGTTHDQTRTLRQKWSDFALLSVFIAVFIIVAAYIRAIWVNSSYVNLARALAILLACCWLLAACVVASEKYLGWTMPDGQTRPGLGWRARVRHAIWTWGNWLVRLLGVKRALVIGGALALLSLTTAVGDNWLGDNNSGYSIVTGKTEWPIAAVLHHHAWPLAGTGASLDLCAGADRCRSRAPGRCARANGEEYSKQPDSGRPGRSDCSAASNTSGCGS